MNVSTTNDNAPGEECNQMAWCLTAGQMMTSLSAERWWVNLPIIPEKYVNRNVKNCWDMYLLHMGY